MTVADASEAVDTGSAATDALFLAGEMFRCADDVVVVGQGNLNDIAVAAQLAAALGGPLLYDHPLVPAEVGRLKPERVHLVGGVDIITPVDAEVLRQDVRGAVVAAKEALGVSTQVGVPASPDSSTIVETVRAIADGDRVVAPALGTTSTSASNNPTIDPSLVVEGLAVETGSDSIWVVDAGNPDSVLLAAAFGPTAGAVPIALDGSNLLDFPELGTALAGSNPSDIRYVGETPAIDEWQLAVLANGVELPGGGYFVLPPDGLRRYVAFYGHPETTALGALGEQGPVETLERMQPFLDAYEGDGSQVVPTFEMIASVASASATEDGDYSYEWPVETFEEWVRTAEENGAYIILDLQSGRDDFLSQAMQYEEMLKLPFVGLALDPEWRLGPNEVHLVQVGSVEAAEVNEVIHWLADLVRDNGLPQKMIIVHQFRTFMIQNRESLEQRPELQLVIQMDGDGTEPQKDNTYRELNIGAENAFWAWGWKNFFDEDEPGPPTPESTMGKDPSPVYVSYQ